MGTHRQSGPDNTLVAPVETERGLVFQIIHGSFVDGPGIRTTVFLKGCPLRCLWCCNPEGQAFHPELKVTSALCTMCGNCLDVCPVAAIQPARASGDECVVVDRTLCTNCMRCVDVCFTGALDLFGEYYTADELLAIVKKDEQYYDASGGGVTIGGGEPTLQPGFVRTFLRRCREYYIHTALDTCGFVTTEDGLRALEEADMLLFDLKGLDPGQHFVDTAASNEVILRNLKRMSDMGKPVIVRMPLIPKHNDSDENVTAAARFLADLKSLVRVDLMAYHGYGTIKYGQLGRQYGLETQTPSDDQMKHFKGIFESCGLVVQLGG